MKAIILLLLVASSVACTKATQKPSVPQSVYIRIQAVGDMDTTYSQTIFLKQ